MAKPHSLHIYSIVTYHLPVLYLALQSPLLFYLIFYFSWNSKMKKKTKVSHENICKFTFSLLFFYFIFITNFLLLHPFFGFYILDFSFYTPSKTQPWKHDEVSSVSSFPLFFIFDVGFSSLFFSIFLFLLIQPSYQLVLCYGILYFTFLYIILFIARCKGIQFSPIKNLVSISW